MQKISRRQVTSYIAAQVLDGAEVASIMQQLAAYLVETRQTKQVEYYIADIEKAVAAAGHTVVDVVSAHSLTDELRTAISVALADGGQVSIREHTDTSLIGGVIIKTPSGEYDASLRSALQRLKTS
jgi:F0F1-type ATP synthase delta subunit